jgi:hypothetical protein
VSWTFFTLMEQHVELRRKVKGSGGVPIFDYRLSNKPALVKANRDHSSSASSSWASSSSMRSKSGLLPILLRPPHPRDLSPARRRFYSPAEAWFQVLYELAVTLYT